jgi:divalent metal cation (Fe/Co/Zn/Cd) transporter
MESSSEQYIEKIRQKSKGYNIAFGLSILSIIFALAEGFFSTYFGYNDESFTLFGFGAGSFIEIFSALGVAHMIIRIQKYPDSNRGDFEQTALRITGFGFYFLVAGLTVISIYEIYTAHKPQSTLSGIFISLISIFMMLILIYGKNKIGKALNSDAILADAECTKVCVYMSIVLLISSGIYAITKFPYIDSLGTLGIAYLSFKEGKECFEKAKSNKNCGCERNSHLMKSVPPTND